MSVADRVKYRTRPSPQSAKRPRKRQKGERFPLPTPENASSFSFSEFGWDKIEANLPCSKSRCFRLEMDDHLLDLTIREYIEFRVTVVLRRIFTNDLYPIPSFDEEYDAREKMVERAEQFIATVAKVYGDVSELISNREIGCSIFDPIGELNDLLIKMQAFAKRERGILAAMEKSKTPNPGLHPVWMTPA
jgi:hypothetical protein